MQLEPKPETLNPSMHADEVGPMFDLAKPVAAYSIKRCGTCSFVNIPCTTQNIKLPILRDFHLYIIGAYVDIQT